MNGIHKMCEETKNNLKQMREDIESGITLTPAMKAQYVHESEFCKLMHEANEGYHEEKNERHKNNYYAKKAELNDIDKEMQRIVDHGHTQHMDHLAKVLSEHFEAIKVSNPTGYTMMLAKLKNI